ncbi:AraC family ligand binding domain-containing protein [Alteromonas ponticola]|uniref:AraC family ligand binding domain-containing protein n=1 Tax=Alteromonas aquimaris TaxID=2998417 RepID=A0ABT3P5X8_9ALTE|nr:cupin domain-containing protein [Alteromonas aquimaris]MCW8108176.1 AraC family ligand binding domain-containing protein [Alteromonas aquimaris]
MSFNSAIFLDQYWQKKPVVLQQFFTDFEDIIDEHELAYLAQDSELDSRAIIKNGQQWNVIQGPFKYFTDVCQHQWTLLVQGVDKVHPEAARMMEAFKFIPYWRMDDLMISFAVAGAGVGPHVDQYDVFLVQGKGSRRWKVGKPGHHDPVYPHPQLAQVAPFEAEIEVELQTGDVLYIPPNWPHEGIATSDCLTYSVGFRAPDTEVLTRSLEALFSDPTFKNLRYSDPALSLQAHPGQVTETSIEKLKDQLLNTLNHPAWEQSLLRLLSEQELLTLPPESLLSAQDLERRLCEGEKFERLTGCRPLFTEKGNQLRIYIDGEYFEVNDDFDVVKRCIEGDAFAKTDLDECHNRPELLSLFADLINKGYWHSAGEP